MRRTFLRSLEKALNQAREGRLHILNIITDTIAEPRADLKPHAPLIETMIILKDSDRAVIGPGRKNYPKYTGSQRSYVVTIDEINNEDT